MSGPAWRSPVAWLAAGLPVACIAAIVVTVRVAGADRVDASAADVRRTAQIQTENLAADRRAAALRLSATLSIDGPDLLLLSNAPTVEPRLTLELIHPTNKSLDRSVELRFEDNGWRGSAKLPPAAAWQLRLSPPSGEWRLVGRIERGQHRATLAPGIAAP